MRKGFTLIELLVVIAIIAVLAVIGVAVYTNILPGVRDGRRREDVNAYAGGWEKKYNASTGEYADIVVGDFSSGIIPSDPSGAAYTKTTTAGSDATHFKSWKICADLESDGRGTSDSDSDPNDFCRSSGQGP